ncbi:MAG: hypothetical protein IJG85_05010 [Eubacteriaceae bacterium]|nr:hypothetical protein [Eubacteriaceae bacterium]
MATKLEFDKTNMRYLPPNVYSVGIIDVDTNNSNEFIVTLRINPAYPLKIKLTKKATDKSSKNEIRAFLDALKSGRYVKYIHNNIDILYVI